jgi:hypothetical protein
MFINDSQTKGLHGKKLNGEAKELYKMKPTTTERFWEKYISASADSTANGNKTTVIP